jgi:hypothetical protein
LSESYNYWPTADFGKKGLMFYLAFETGAGQIKFEDIHRYYEFEF